MKRRHTNWIALGLLAFVCGGLGAWVVVESQELRAIYDFVDTTEASLTKPVAQVELDGRKFTVPSWDLLYTGNLWGVVSAKRQLPVDYKSDLVDTSVAHAQDVTAKVNPSMAAPLSNLFTAAAQDGLTLMLSSAYRSVDEQQQTYDWYATSRGQAYANKYVALAHASEHQTGLAVDIASSSWACQRDSNSCSLTAEAVVWLQKNAPSFGFIQRYPPGKQSITGTAEEAWHYRYVGLTLARFLTDNNLTLDEFSDQVLAK